MNNFWDIKILWILYWGQHKYGLYFGAISMQYRVFSLCFFLWGAKIQICFGVCLIFLIFLLYTVNSGSKPHSTKNESIPLGRKHFNQLH